MRPKDMSSEEQEAYKDLAEAAERLREVQNRVERQQAEAALQPGKTEGSDV